MKRTGGGGGERNFRIQHGLPPVYQPVLVLFFFRQHGKELERSGRDRANEAGEVTIEQRTGRGVQGQSLLCYWLKSFKDRLIYS